MQWIGEGIEAMKMKNQIEYVRNWVYNKEQEKMKEQGSMNVNVINSKREIGESSKIGRKWEREGVKELYGYLKDRQKGSRKWSDDI